MARPDRLQRSDGRRKVLVVYHVGQGGNDYTWDPKIQKIMNN
jgi:hypothetical protein